LNVGSNPNACIRRFLLILSRNPALPELIYLKIKFSIHEGFFIR
jgi:hypothetical protein